MAKVAVDVAVITIVTGWDEAIDVSAELDALAGPVVASVADSKELTSLAMIAVTVSAPAFVAVSVLV